MGTLQAIFLVAPGYEQFRGRLVEEWAPEAPSLCHEYGELALWVVEMAGSQGADLRALSEHVETLLGSEDVTLHDIAASCFVEVLVNHRDKLPSQFLWAFLGPRATSVAVSWLPF